MPVVEATETYVQAGRRGHVHRRTISKGKTFPDGTSEPDVVQTGVERCNLDQLRWPERVLTEAEFEALPSKYRCRYCFPPKRP